MDLRAVAPLPGCGAEVSGPSHRGPPRAPVGPSAGRFGWGRARLGAMTGARNSPTRFKLVAAAAIVAGAVMSAAPATGDADGGPVTEQIRGLAEELAELRGISLRGPIDGQVLPEDALVDRMRQVAARSDEEGQAAGVTRALARLGAAEASAPFRGTLAWEAAPSAHQGFYDPYERRLYVRNDAAHSDRALVWGVARAVHDQHVDWQTFLGEAGNSDEFVARRALLEGDAVALALEQGMRREGVGIVWGNDAVTGMLRQLGRGDEGGPLSEAPADLRERLLFPYREGTAFIARARRHGAWSAIDDMYDRPPLSTSHILHPERYERYERPRVVEPGDIGPDRVYRSVYDDVSGELGLKTWLAARGVSRQRAARAADGWAGDRLVVYAPPGPFSLVWSDLAISYSTWHTEIDAVEFFEAGATALASLAGGAGAAHPEEDRIVYELGDYESAWIERRGEDVIFVLGAMPSFAESLPDVLWDSWAVERP